MKVLVLGGTGWVGHSIARIFSEDGAAVAACSRGKNAGFTANLPKNIRILRADKNNDAEMRQILAEPYDVIVDSVPTEAAIDLIVAHAKNLKHYIHCSSTGGYAPLPRIPGDETMPYHGFMGDGWKQKSIVDSKVMGLFHQKGFPATVIRPSYITGPGMLPLDNLGGRRQDFIPDILTGKTLDLPNDGLALLHPVHFEGLARSFFLAAHQPRSIGETYNICLDKAVTIRRYVEINAGAFGRTAGIALVPLDKMLEKYKGVCSPVGLCFLANHMCYDISKARRDLGYEPPMSTEEAIEETALWAMQKSR